MLERYLIASPESSEAMGQPQQTSSTALESGSRRLQEVFEHAAAGMAIVDLTGRFCEVNPAYSRMLNRPADQLIAHENILELTHPDDRQQNWEQLERLLAGEIPSYVIEKRCLRGDGEIVWVRNSVSLLHNAQGKPVNVIAICEDITERRKAEHALQESEKLAVVGRLASSIAHEINNPLEAVTNLLYLAGTAPSLESAQQFVRMAEREVARVSEITTQTLRFHKQKSSPLSTNLVEVMKSVLTMFQGRLSQAGVKVVSKFEDSPELICFPGEIRQVFANLIGNAMDAMVGGGELKVRVRPATHWDSESEGVRVTIADTGHGMSRETKEKIFEPFFTTKGMVGTGLGLWVTSNVIAKHHGRLNLKSRNSSPSGSVFSVVFPYKGAKGEAAA